MLPFKKRDEMEQEIHKKSVLISHSFTSVALVVWIIVDLICQKSAILPLYLLIAQLIIQKLSALIFRHSVDDERWKKGLLLLIVSVILILFSLLIAPGQ